MGQSNYGVVCGVLTVWLVLCDLAIISAERVVPRWCKNALVRHVHLSVGLDPSTEMIVTFASIPSFAGVSAPLGGVDVGTSMGRWDAKFLHSNTTSYRIPCRKGRGNDGKNSDMYYSPFYHHVTLTGLTPGTTYYYRPFVLLHPGLSNNVTNSQWAADRFRAADKFEANFNTRRRLDRHEKGLAAYDGSKRDCPSEDKIRTFRTAPSSQDHSNQHHHNPVTFAIVGDLGQYKHSEATLSSLMRSAHEIDSVILSGDLAYSRLDHRQWDTFFDLLEDYPIAEMKPLQIVPGNHDIDKTQYSPSIFLAYENRFRMPRVKPPLLGVYEGTSEKLNMDQPPYPLNYEWGNAYYVYSYGPVRMLMLSAYSSMEPGSAQYKWIVTELSTVNRKKTPWLCVVIHTPLYNTFGVHRHDLQIIAARKHLEPLFVQYKVNIVFSGHIHAYSRSTGINDGVVDARGPVHIVVGAGGRKCEAPFREAEPEPWVQVRDATSFGYGLWRILNATHARWDWMHTGHADDHKKNELYRTNITLPAGPSIDKLFLRNQYFSS